MNEAENWRARLRQGVVIPAMPLALRQDRRFDERRQNALLQYYVGAGAGGLAVGVHTTQFEIRHPDFELFEPVLRFVAERLGDLASPETFIRVAGICGRTAQAVQEAELARNLGYRLGLLNLSALKDEDEETLLAHCAEIGKIIPLFGFYLQPSVGGVNLPYAFWRKFAEIESVIAIKIAPFNRYQTLDVVRAVCESSRSEEIALYTGNDDNIIADLLTAFTFPVSGKPVTKKIVGGLLGHWAYWTRKAVELLSDIKAIGEDPIPPILLERGVQTTDANAAIFDAANAFAGCIPGIHYILHQQGFLEGVYCLDPAEDLSPGRRREIERVRKAYPHLTDDDFVAERIDDWLS